MPDYIVKNSETGHIESNAVPYDQACEYARQANRDYQTGAYVVVPWSEQGGDR